MSYLEKFHFTGSRRHPIPQSLLGTEHISSDGRRGVVVSYTDTDLIVQFAHFYDPVLRFYDRILPIGTRSLLFGVHHFLFHPLCLAVAWTKLYGFPTNWRLWVAFAVHDWGYWGKPNMDGPEGDTHPELGAKIMHKLCDGTTVTFSPSILLTWQENRKAFYGPRHKSLHWFWHDFTLLHSRFYAKNTNDLYSPLCVADKFVITVLPWWIYVPFGMLSGEIYEYMRLAAQGENGKYKGWTLAHTSKKEWHKSACQKMREWAELHKHLVRDEVTHPTRDTRREL